MLLGIPHLIFESFPKLKALRFSKCALETAEILLVIDNHGQPTLIEMETQSICLLLDLPTNVRYFNYRHTKFIWQPIQRRFVTVDELLSSSTLDELLENTYGLNESEYKIRYDIYGPNKIEVEIKSYWTLLVEEVLNLFYAFQAFSVILWLVDEYMLYAICIILLTIFSSITSLIQTRKQSEALHDLVESSKCHNVSVLRKSPKSKPDIIKIEPVDLVPGDLIVLPPANFILPCDVVLLTGQCIVNESVLTGESVPVTKTALHSGSELYDPETHKRHTLFAGTHMIQTRFYGGENVFARVVRTGFSTTKGSLVKSILFPTPVGLKFYKDSLKFVFFLFTIAVTGMAYCLYLYISRNADLKDIIVRTLDIVTIVVPPALPAAMTVGILYSQERLKKIGIFCISPPRINVCGRVKIACFDKTGTLTDDGLDMSYVIPSKDQQFLDPVTDVSTLDTNSEFVQAMATCHSLTTVDGVLCGDPLDMSVFDFTQWEMEEPGANENARYDMLAPTVVKPPKHSIEKITEPENFEVPFEIGIIRQFPFSSTLQCMSVIAKSLQKHHMVAYTKGAPEKIRGMCKPETLPHDYDVKLAEFTARGYRVIAVAYKNLSGKFSWKDAQKVKRDVIEQDLNFLGLLIMQNPLKVETAPVISTLRSANIRTVMITGDNILTAISVAYDCGMLRSHDDVFVLTASDDDVNTRFMLERTGLNRSTENVVINFDSRHHHIAVDGRTWSKLKYCYPEAVPDLLVKSTIFARFQPDQKAEVVTHLQELDYIVSMVGDGANDCGALKAAHVGVSLSPAEASVAAPFTSKIQNISCIVNLLLEGRCALVTSFAIFKYMALYSLIQFFTILILYRQHSLLGDYQFLFIDLIITTSLAVTIGRQGPPEKLCPQRPPSSLVAAKNVIPLLLQITACALFQLGAMYMLFQQSWFQPIPDDVTEPQIVSWENLVLFTVSCYQYIILASVYSKGMPYRERLRTNYLFVLSAVSLTVFVTWLLIYPCKKMAELMELIATTPDEEEKFMFRVHMLIFPTLHLLIAVSIEAFISDQQWLKRCIQCLKRKSKPKNKYKRLLQQRNTFPWLNTIST
ncbi:unnamed protein product [Acanthoscelides obtectus]|nr:unnamed protein product [Acanthoscelides obtectus]CAK1620746.1 Probable cation-transporting ATPase 13A3 [Acanthoscelides obtectus]